MSKTKNDTKAEALTKKKKMLALVKKLDTKGNSKNSAIETVKDLVVGVAGGGLAGAAIGKPSLLVGLGVSFVGHYAESPLATSLGLGMMASGGYQIGSAAISGLDGMSMDAVKGRVKAFGQNIKERLYLDKLIKPKADAISGLGNVQYFKYPQDNSIDMGALDNLEQQIIQSGAQYERQMTGAYDDLSGAEEKLY